MTPEISRMCVVTREKKPNSELFRVVRLKSGEIKCDFLHKEKARGAYISKSLKVIIEGQKRKALSKALRKDVGDEIYIELIQHLK